MSSATKSHLLLPAATADSIFAMGQGLHTPDFFTQYWGTMSRSLTRLETAFEGAITPEMSLALNQLTRLQSLLLEGMGDNAAIMLQLPSLTKLTLHDFGDTIVSLDCPQLKDVKLSDLHLLEDISGISDGIETLWIYGMGSGSVPLEQMLPVQGLKQLVHLHLRDCPGKAIAIRDAYVPSRLTSLTADSAWLPLLPFQAPWQALPYNLIDLSLMIPLSHGIPLVLEQLCNLEGLELCHVGSGQMHLTRSLDPFLDMPRLVYLALYGDQEGEWKLVRWTTDALRLLGLADRRIMAMRKAKFVSIY